MGSTGPLNPSPRRDVDPVSEVAALPFEDRVRFASQLMAARSQVSLAVRQHVLRYVPRVVPDHRPRPDPNPILWQYWAQGANQAPDIVRACLRSSLRHKGHLEHRLIDDTTIAAHVEMPPEWGSRKGMTRTHFSDLLRLALLARHGGLWADATVFFSRPIEAEIGQVPFLAFSRPSDPFLLSNWFIRAWPEHPLIVTWMEALQAYWQDNDTLIDYFVMHHLFEAITEVHPALRAQWVESPIVSSRDAHRMQDALLMERDTIDLQPILEKTGVHKLTWKLPTDQVSPTSLFRLIEQLD